MREKIYFYGKWGKYNAKIHNGKSDRERSTKMTNKEAIGQLKCNNEGDYIVDDDLKAFIYAIRALEMQIPKKPKGDYHSCPHYRCPNCNSSVKMYEHDNTYPHCAFCGQALDWKGGDTL